MLLHMCVCLCACVKKNGKGTEVNTHQKTAAVAMVKQDTVSFRKRKMTAAPRRQ